MQIKSAHFVISNTDYKKCPTPDKPEYAFIGRSNVGKSSLINMLVNQSDLAKTSSKPGKTQLINHFIINENIKPWYLVDLPGYGYAKSSKSNVKQWSKFSTDYLLKRTNLLCVFLLVDSRLAPQKIDLEFMQWMAENQLAFCLVFTKTDKLSRTALKKNIDTYKNILLESWEELPPVFCSSASQKTGKEDILRFIEENNQIMNE
ncbi:MAG: YihA family ribosome biogenesis GTP-binding protein [Bacteroidia bacterium]|nr:YihA family ribosome biogenesis GTP-binding protein [Bacteroidia bacterium]MCZ2247567.1 ribosome biogenesis GTP-binding protein YihA/YsxC [Bacteroidia bacterium]